MGDHIVAVSGFVCNAPMAGGQRRDERSGVSFWAFLGSALLFGLLQRPWKGRALSSSQWGLVLTSGGLLVLSFLLRLEGLRSIGPLETILADYAGAVGCRVLLNSTRKGSKLSEKVAGFTAMLTALFLLSQGWALASCSPLSFKSGFRLHTYGSRWKQPGGRLYRSNSGSGSEGASDGRECVRILSILAPTLAGVVHSLQKLLASRTCLKCVSKKRLSGLTIGAGVLVLFSCGHVAADVGERIDEAAPFCRMAATGHSWVRDGGSFYGDSYSEEKLQVPAVSPRLFFITTCCVCLLELLYGSNISLLGFLFCSLLLGIGVRLCTFASGGLSWEAIVDHQSSSCDPTFSGLVKNPLQHIISDSKSRRIAVFLLISTAFMVVEFVYGFVSNSLGLISDACHMLFDCAALAIGLYASYISKLQANSKFNYGYGRFEVLSGYANAVFLILVASLIVLESLERILDPPEISTQSLLLVSVGGLLVNLVGLIFFHEAHHHHSGPCVHSHDLEHQHKPLRTLTPPSSICGDCQDSADYKVLRLEDVHQHSLQSGWRDHNHVHEGNGTEIPTNCDSRNGQEQNGAGVHHLEQNSGNENDLVQHLRNHEEQGNLHQPLPQQDGLHHRVHHHDDIDHDHNNHIEDRGKLHSADQAYAYSGQELNGHELSSSEEEIHGTHGHEHHHHFPKKSGKSLRVDNHEHHNDHYNCNHGAHDDDHDEVHSHDHSHIHDHGHNHHQSHYHSHEHGDDHDHQHMDHNMQGIFLHVLADTLGSVGVVVSTLLIKYKGWLFTDPACSIFISSLIIASVVPLVRNSAEMLLQRVPRVAESRLKQAMNEVEALKEVHHFQHLHVWSITNTETVGSLHLYAGKGSDKQWVQSKVSYILKEAGITDLSIQVEEV